MKRFFSRIGRFFWSWGFLKLVLWTATIIVLFYAEEDWRGARMWAATKAKWEARGETFDYAKFIPPPVPEAQNLAALPVFQLEPDLSAGGSLQPLKLSKAISRAEQGEELPNSNDWDGLRPAVAKTYARFFGSANPPDSLTQLEALYPIISDLRANAPTHPEFQLATEYKVNPPWDRGYQPIVRQIGLCKLIALHALIALQENRPKVALDDISLSMELARGVERDPSIVAGLVSIGIVAISRGVVREGLERHCWNDSQLAELQSELASIDFLKQYLFVLRAVTVAETVPTYAIVKAKRSSMLLDLANVSSKSPTGTGAAIFHDAWAAGWWDMDQAKMVDFLFREVRVIDPELRRVDVATSRRIKDEVTKAGVIPRELLPWNLLFTKQASALTDLARTYAEIQSWVDEDRIACALERYRLAHGTYPSALNELSPALIDAMPIDIMNGEPYRYRPINAEKFLLYSVGWNQMDDGGKIAFEPGESVHYEQGDWVWPMPPKH